MYIYTLFRILEEQTQSGPSKHKWLQEILLTEAIIHSNIYNFLNNLVPVLVSNYTELYTRVRGVLSGSWRLNYSSFCRDIIPWINSSKIIHSMMRICHFVATYGLDRIFLQFLTYFVSKLFINIHKLCRVVSPVLSLTSLFKGISFSVFATSYCS